MGVKQRREAIGLRTAVITQCSDRSHDVRIHPKQQLGLGHQGQLHAAGKNQQVLEAHVRGTGGGIPGRKNMGVGVGVLQGVTEKSGGS